MAEPTKTREGDQPLPTPGRECVQDALINLIEERKQLGLQRYGSPLMTHNGRDSVRDALEEALDLTAYLMQVEMEMADLRAEVQRLQSAAEGIPAGISLGRVRAELDRLDGLGTVTADNGRANSFGTGARWTIRMLRNVLDDARCCICGSDDVRYRNYRNQPFCLCCADGRPVAVAEVVE